MVNTKGVVKKGLRELKKNLRNRAYGYFNKHLKVDMLIQMYKNHTIKNSEVIINLENVEQENEFFFVRFATDENLTKHYDKKTIIFIDEINNLFLKQFEAINNRIKTASLLNVREEEEDEKEITNLKKKEDDDVFIPNRELELTNVHTLINKYEEFDFELNDKIKKRNDEGFNFNKINTVKKFEINVKGKVYEDDKIDKLVSEFLYICPKCFEKIYYLPNQTYTTIKHGCDGYVASNGKQVYTRIDEKTRMASNSKQIWLYEFTIGDNETSRYAYSFKPDIKQGRYTADILLTVDSLNGGSKKNLALILGIRKEKIEIINDLVTDKESKKWCKKKGLPHIRLLDALFSIRKMHKHYTVHDLNDKGMLNQIFITFSGLMKLIFKNRCFGVNVIGSTSLSKSYTGQLFSLALDRDYSFVQNSTDVSIPGLKGGINNQKEINGEKVTIFEEGIFTRGGLTIFDEGNNFFSDENLNASLKDLFNTTINIQKIGGKKGIKQNYTPIIYSNSSNHHIDYSNYVTSVYTLFINHVTVEVPHLKSDDEIIRYLNTINLYMPVSYYITFEKNEHLARAIYYVRKMMERKDLSWRTGGSIPANYRLLFDVLCFTTEETFEKCGVRVMERTETIMPEVYDIPFEELQAALLEYYNGGKVDLYKVKENDKSVIRQLKSLFDDINNFLISDGVEIHIHLSGNCKRMDEKLGYLVSTFIAGLQLLEDINSTKLSDNVKVWSKLILLKCKRGLTKDEYDFKTHPVYEFKRYDMSELLGDIKAIKKDREMVRIVKDAFKKQEEVEEKLNLKVED